MTSLSSTVQRRRTATFLPSLATALLVPLLSRFMLLASTLPSVGQTHLACSKKLFDVGAHVAPVGRRGACLGSTLRRPFGGLKTLSSRKLSHRGTARNYVPCTDLRDPERRTRSCSARNEVAPSHVLMFSFFRGRWTNLHGNLNPAWKEAFLSYCGVERRNRFAWQQASTAAAMWNCTQKRLSVARACTFSGPNDHFAPALKPVVQSQRDGGILPENSRCWFPAYPYSGRKSNSTVVYLKQEAQEFVMREAADPRVDLWEVPQPENLPQVQLIAKKLRMSEVFGPDATCVPATVLQVLPATVVRFVEFGQAVVSFGKRIGVERRFVKKPVLGELCRVSANGAQVTTIRLQPPREFYVGQLLETSLLLGAQHVDVTGTGKGKGFAGVMARHGFHGGPASHGSRHHRHAGSIGAGTFPGRVLPRTKMAGRAGGRAATIRNMKVLGVNLNSNTFLVMGGVPGSRNGTLLVTRRF